MSSFLFFIVLIAVILYFNSSVASLEQRIVALEQKLGVRLGRSLEQSIDPIDQEALRQAGINAGAMFQQALVGVPVTTANVAPSPAPAPAPAYASGMNERTPQRFADENQEETSARWLGWVGAVMLLLGVAFFLKYAFDNDWVGPTGQVAIGIIAGLAAIGLGQKLRAKYLKYSDILFGAGIGILYFSIYAGFAFYDPVVISQPVAFALMIMVTVLAMVIAVAGGTINIAALGVFGGFLTPIMLSTGENHLVTLSLYMIVLNLGVLGVSWFTKWMKLNYLAFLGTLILFGGWMGDFYWRDPDGQLALTFFFLTTFFVIFLANSIMHHFVRKERSSSGDLALLLLNAMGYFGVCYSILEPKHHDMLGFFAFLLAVLYLAVAYVAHLSNTQDRTMNLTLPGIAVVFLSIAIPLQLSDYWISIAWLIESLVLVYVGLMIKEKPIQVFGWIVLFLGMASMLSEVAQIRNIGMSGISGDRLMPIMNMGFFLLLLGVLTFYALAKLYAKWQHPESEWKRIVALFVILANLLTVYVITSEISFKYDQDIRSPSYFNSDSDMYIMPMLIPDSLESSKNTVISISWTLYAIILVSVGFIKRMRMIRLFGLIFFFVTACKVFIEVWALGQIYRIISTIAFGVIALGAAFLYAKYKDRLKEIIYDEA
jgi:uncharacterized membrane protein